MVYEGRIGSVTNFKKYFRPYSILVSYNKWNEAESEEHAYLIIEIWTQNISIYR